MKIEVIALGNEILKGSTVNSNAATISKKLAEHGYQVKRHTVVRDDSSEIEDVLQEALSRSDWVVVTGGLGPTVDDQTKTVMAKLFNTPFVFDETLYESLLARYPDLITAKQLATIPQKAQTLPNNLGTAPGFFFQIGDKRCSFLPGVPNEMESMLEESVIPRVTNEFPIVEKKYHQVIDICLHNEDEIQKSILKEIEQAQNVEIGIYPYYAGVRVEIGAFQSELPFIKAIVDKLKSTYKDFIYSTEGESLEAAVQRAFEKKKMTLATAESCTGGSIAATITALPGSSSFFLGSIVAYSNEVKEGVLHVSKETLEEKGAVSKETIQEMLNGVFETTTADYAIATSGIAGPTGGTKDKPIGTVWVGIAKRGGISDIGLIKAPPKRKAVVQYTVNTVLGIIWRIIEHNKAFFNDQE